MAHRARDACVLLVLALAAAASGEVGGLWADVGVLEQRENATVPLFVVNRAASGVTLANCLVKHAVPAGANLTVSLTGLTGFWIVPDGVTWDCQTGPFNLFTVAANLTGPDLIAAVGYGLPGNMASASGQAETGAVTINSTDKVAGVEFGAGAGAERTVRCHAAGCEEGYNVTSVPDQFVLAIMGPQVSLLSFWYGGGGWHGGGPGRWGGGGWRPGGWGGGGWHGHGWGGGGWRHPGGWGGGGWP